MPFNTELKTSCIERVCPVRARTTHCARTGALAQIGARSTRSPYDMKKYFCRLAVFWRFKKYASAFMLPYELDEHNNHDFCCLDERKPAAKTRF